ncbi:hypothetical protein P389DRAFT_72780 [Cystobasidium minutum MCA 4210]|uniref:uncharacterized protein n=1 Tax=Cystobasidium minutum MCA 4210 TaxID=1397322 RepID=UPI0034CD596D|eukprot:jgi/Rhomi1/72780/CE72779_1753
MYYPGNAANYNPNGPPPPPAGPPPPPPPMSAEAAAAYENYGYGNVAPRPGKRNGQPPNGRGPQAPPGMYQQGPTPYPPGGQPPMMQPGMAHQPPGAPYPPAKRAKYDSKGAASPVYMQQPPPHAGTPPYQGQVYQPTMYQAAGHPAQQQPMAMHMGQPYYPQQAYVPQPAQPPYHYQPQMHHSLPQAPQHQGTSGSAPPLAVALMKATPMAANNNNTGSRPPPPPPSSAPLPPPPPSEPSIPSGPKGLASLPERPMSSTLPSTLPPTPATASSSTSVPTGPAIPTGPSAYKTSIKRDTRPLPSQSRHAGESLRGPGRGGANAGGGHRGRGPPTGPSRGGGGRGGRGGRSGFDNQRGPNRPQNQQQHRRDERNDHAAHDREKGAKRTFSQTGPPRGPATRPRTNSNATATSASIPTGPSKKNQSSATKKRERTMEGSPAPPSSNSKGLKRTLTDFRIESLEIPLLHWSWKATPLSQILAKMNLKEKEELVGTRDDVPYPAVAQEKQLLPKAEATTENSAASCVDPAMPPLEQVKEESVQEEATVAGSSDMQRSDSKPENRKHARDEDDDDEVERDGRVASEEVKDLATYPIGKKVKSEAIGDLPLAESGSVALPAGSVEAVSDETTAEAAEPPQAEAGTLSETKLEEQAGTAAADDAPSDVKEEPVEDHVSDTSESADEIAETIIANRPSEVKEGEADLEATPAPEKDDVADEQEVIPGEEGEGPLIINRIKTEDTPKSVPKKFWENSRLRIYFMSPVELEQKDVRQNLLKKPKVAAAPAQPESERSIRESSAETITEKTIITSEAQDPAKVEESTQVIAADVEAADGTDATEATADDLDGEPLAIEAQASDVDNKVADSDSQAKQEEAADKTTAAPRKEEPQGTLAGATNENGQKLLPPSADRLSIAYAQNTRRLIIDAEVVDQLVLHRAEGKIEITVRAEEPLSIEEGKDFRCAKGVFVEKSTSAGEHSYEEIGFVELQKGWNADEATQAAEPLDGESVAADHLSPPLHRLSVEGKDATSAEKDGARRFTIIAKMDRAHPLTEAKWVRTGNPDDWILSVIGNGGGASNSLGGARAAQQLPKGEQGNDPSSLTTSKNGSDVTTSAWKGKIRVVDPDAVRLLLSSYLHTRILRALCSLFLFCLSLLSSTNTAPVVSSPHPSLADLLHRHQFPFHLTRIFPRHNLLLIRTLSVPPSSFHSPSLQHRPFAIVHATFSRITNHSLPLSTTHWRTGYRPRIRAMASMEHATDSSTNTFRTSTTSWKCCCV